MSKIKSQMSIIHNKSGKWAKLFKITRKHEFANVDSRTNLLGLGWFRILSNHYHYKPTLVNYQHYYILKEAMFD